MQASRKNSEDSLFLKNQTQNESTTGNVLFATDDVNDADPSVRVDSLNYVSSSDNEYVSLLDITTSTISSSMAPDFKFKIPSPPSVKPKEIELTDASAPGVSSSKIQSEVLQSGSLSTSSGYSYDRN